MPLRHVPAKRFMVKSGLGDFACNPYVGCTHGCQYCYARFMGDYAERPEPWGTYVDVKDYPDYDIPRNTGEKTLMFSSVTDAWQPAEETARRTREILENVCESNLHFSFLTKSALVLRDLDLIRKMKHVEVGFSVALDDETASVLEPGASRPSERLAALRELNAAGIRTFVFIAPILPEVTDVFGILDAVGEAATFVMFDGLSLKHAENRANIFKFIWNRRPSLLPLYREIFEEGNRSYYDQLAEKIRARGENEGREYRIFFGKGK